MSHPTPQDPERGNDPNFNHNQYQSTADQPLAPQVESNFGDSSEPIFSMYTKTAEEEDNKMVDRWQKDADGILIFTGLFSASVAALLSVTVGDLKPNSQDTSNFYLGNIYGLLADPNVTRASIPSSAAKPPPFSAPRYAVWVNSLWFLSLVMSVSCAMWATSLNQWARRYIRLTQPARCSPDKRARLRAFYANGVDKMHTPWAVEGLPMLLHLSLFLFFGGLAVYLFNVNQGVFTCVVSWIGLFLLVYGLISLLPVLRVDSPYNTPLSTPLWFLFSYISFSVFIVFYFTFVLGFMFLVCCCGLFVCCSDSASADWHVLWKMFKGLHRWRLENDANFTWWVNWKSGGGKERAEKQSPVIDGRILGWTISTLGDDDSLEKFFEAMPGFFDSELTKDIREHLPYDLLRNALAGFLGRTLSSKSVIHSVKLHRLDIFTNTIKLIGEDSIRVASILETFLLKSWDLAPQTVEAAHTLDHWTTNNDQRTALYARCTVARVLATVPERDGHWVEFAARISGLSEDDLQDIAQPGDNLLLAALIDLCRQTDDRLGLKLVEAFLRFDILHTLPRLQHDFCALWNEIVDKARIRGDPQSTRVRIQVLCSIRHLYLDLHPDTYEISGLNNFGFVTIPPSSYPQCNIAAHRHFPEIGHARDVNSGASFLSSQPGDLPHSLVRRSTFEGIVPRQVTQEGITTRPRSLSEPTPKVIAKNSQKAATLKPPTLLVQTRPYSTHAPLPLPGAVSTPQGILPVTTMSYPPESKWATQWDIAPCTEPDSKEKLSTVSTTVPTLTLASVPAFTPPFLDHSLASCDTGAASAPNPLLSASSVIGFSIPASPPPSHVPPSSFPSSRIPLSPVTPLPNSDSLGFLNSTTPFHLTGSPNLPRIRARGLMNTKNMCFVNAALQILVHSPLLWNLFNELGDLKGQRREGDPETNGGATPLMDATARLFEEFMLNEKEPPQESADGKPKEHEEATKMHDVIDSFEPMYLYEAMEEKRSLKILLDGKHEDVEEFLCLYLDALGEELVELKTYIGPVSAPSAEELEERVQSAEGQSRQTRLVKRDHTASSVESPISRIFGGTSRLTIRAPNQPDTTTLDYWRSLRLNIQPDSVHNIQDALALVSQPQPVRVSQSNSSGASQQMQIEALPPVLILQLERFLYDATADGTMKIKKPVQFAPELEIPLEIMAPVAGKSAELAHYNLYGVLYHHGESAGSGHYTVDVLHPNGGDSGSEEDWLHIDDKIVSAVRQEDVFGHDNGRANEQSAYMLFYYRTAPT